jgi:hypothetical protein
MEAWARAPHSAEVSQFMEALLRPWRDDLAAIVARGVEEGEFVPPDGIDDFTLRFVALLSTGLRCSACASCISCPASASSNWQ